MCLSYYKDMDEEAGYHYGRRNAYGQRRPPYGRGQRANYCGPPPPVTRWKRRDHTTDSSNNLPQWEGHSTSHGMILE